MTKLNPSEILLKLITNDPVRLDALPSTHGIYALHDHTGAIRYIGITKSDRYGFHGRINNRHATGSEGRSHKFSHAYNTGRMWREKSDKSSDALLAKALRTIFIRKHCRATFVTVLAITRSELEDLEAQVQPLAPDSMLDWVAKRAFSPLPEPTQLLDALLDERNYSAQQRAAIQRQVSLHLLSRDISYARSL